MTIRPGPDSGAESGPPGEAHDDVTGRVNEKTSEERVGP